MSLPVAILPITQEALEPEQCQALMTLLETGSLITNFEIQRALFGGELNKYARNGIKNYLRELTRLGKIVQIGNKRGTRYQLTSFYKES